MDGRSSEGWGIVSCTLVVRMSMKRQDTARALLVHSSTYVFTVELHSLINHIIRRNRARKKRWGKSEPHSMFDAIGGDGVKSIGSRRGNLSK